MKQQTFYSFSAVVMAVVMLLGSMSTSISSLIGITETLVVRSETETAATDSFVSSSTDQTNHYVFKFNTLFEEVEVELEIDDAQEVPFRLSFNFPETAPVLLAQEKERVFIPMEHEKYLLFHSLRLYS